MNHDPLSSNLFPGWWNRVLWEERSSWKERT